MGPCKLHGRCASCACGAHIPLRADRAPVRWALVRRQVLADPAVPRLPSPPELLAGPGRPAHRSRPGCPAARWGREAPERPVPPRGPGRRSRLAGPACRLRPARPARPGVPALLSVLVGRRDPAARRGRLPRPHQWRPAIPGFPAGLALPRGPRRRWRPAVPARRCLLARLVRLGNRSRPSSPEHPSRPSSPEHPLRRSCPEHRSRPSCRSHPSHQSLRWSPCAALCPCP
jgi:hypothetical protein